MMHDQPGLYMTDPLVDPRTVLKVPQELTTPPKNEPQMRTQPEELSPEKENLLKKLKEDHQFYLKMCQDRLWYLRSYYIQFYKKKKSIEDDQYDRLLAGNFPLQQWKKQYNQSYQRLDMQARMYWHLSTKICKRERLNEEEYYVWVSQDPYRQQNLFQQYLANRNCTMTQGQENHLGYETKRLISILLKHTHTSLRQASKQTLCRAFRATKRILPQRFLRKLRRSYKKALTGLI